VRCPAPRHAGRSPASCRGVLLADGDRIGFGDAPADIGCLGLGTAVRFGRLDLLDRLGGLLVEAELLDLRQERLREVADGDDGLLRGAARLFGGRCGLALGLLRLRLLPQHCHGLSPVAVSMGDRRRERWVAQRPDVATRDPVSSAHDARCRCGETLVQPGS
jgi:hypothetical protein